MQINSNYPWFVANGQLHLTEKETKWPLASPMIYEVIRLIGGKPLFYQAHMERLAVSAQLLHVDIEPLLAQIHEGVDTLIRENAIEADNIKLVIGNLDQPVPNWIVFGVKGFYPPSSWFEQGIKTTLIHVERHNPHAKVINTSLAERVDHLRQTTDCFEALLVDDKGRITEGSRSNVFFIKDGELLMPRTDLALKGITRDKLLRLTGDLGISCREADVYAEELTSYDGLFVTGTSIDLLPIAAVDGCSFKTAELPLMKKLLAGYRQLMQDSLNVYNHK